MFYFFSNFFILYFQIFIFIFWWIKKYSIVDPLHPILDLKHDVFVGKRKKGVHMWNAFKAHYRIACIHNHLCCGQKANIYLCFCYKIFIHIPADWPLVRFWLSFSSQVAYSYMSKCKCICVCVCVRSLGKYRREKSFWKKSKWIFIIFFYIFFCAILQK